MGLRPGNLSGSSQPQRVCGQSPRLLYSATLGATAATFATPTGFRPKPKVAVLSYLGGHAGTFRTPTGLWPKPKVAVLSYLGCHGATFATPTGLWPKPKVAVLSYLGCHGGDLRNPNGVVAKAQGCCTQLPWVPRRRPSQPQRGCGQSPRLLYSATLGATAATFATPTGFRLIMSQRL